MKKINLIAFVVGLFVSLSIFAQEGKLAFPGAEGFGRYATGGRGGEIFHVTTLEDSGAGSFRDAVSQEGRIIVFDVSGVIRLKSALVVKGNNTILGQTAPGEGVQVYGHRVSFSGASNLIVRYIRFRMGLNGTDGADACGIANGTDMIFDHLSVLWGRDENFSINWDNKGTKPGNITIQNSIIGQGLQSHSCGGLIQTDGGVTLYRNLYIENKTRNPKVKGLNQYVNNVVYNWGNGGCYIMGDTEGASWAHIEGNYFVNGPWNGATAPFTRGSSAFKFYGAGNLYDNNKDGELNGYELSVEEQVGRQKGSAEDGSEDKFSTYVESFEQLNANADIPQQIPVISQIMTATEAYGWMLKNVGPVLPVRDEVDQYIIDELSSYGTAGTKNGISGETQLPHKGTGVLSGGVKPLDSDGDGIPDEWEIANGLNPQDATDAVAIAANGYANIENYAFSITEAYPYIKKPLSLTINQTNKESFEISWMLNANTTAGFIIEAAAENADFVEMNRVEAGVTTCVIENLIPETAYRIRVRAFDGTGIYSEYAEVSGETINDPTEPKISTDPTPANASKEGIANGLTFTWQNATKNYGGTVTYTLLLGTDEATLAPVASGLSTTTYTTTDLEADKTYYWRVDATNDLGTTPGSVWHFSTTAGGVLFYTDFHTTPQAWVEKYGSITANTDLINAANKTVSVAGMTIGSGENSLRILNMPGCHSTDGTKDYGPYTVDDEGATPYCIQFNTTKEGGYITTPEVQGPCVITVMIGNPQTSQQTIKLFTEANGEESAQSFQLAAAKRMFKLKYTYPNAGPVSFKIDANAKKVNINDILIERYVPNNGEQALEMTSGNLINENLSYADGSLVIGFNQEIVYNGGAVIKGVNKFEEISITTSGSRLNINYEALDVNTPYSVSFPAGAITPLTGSQSFLAEVKFTTGDFPRSKETGETHYGKAVAQLPLNFAPFTAVAPFVTEGALVQSKQNDYPHWVQVSGGVTDDEALITSTSDKIMCYVAPAAKQLALDLEYEGTGGVVFKVQESRNCDITPGWRTIRVLRADDFPFVGTLDLNPESHFVKISGTTIAGSVKVKSFRISDAQGNFESGEGTALTTTEAIKPVIRTINHRICISGLSAGAAIRVVDVTGRMVTQLTAEGDSTSIELPFGIYLVCIDDAVVKVKL